MKWCNEDGDKWADRDGPYPLHDIKKFKNCVWYIYAFVDVCMAIYESVDWNVDGDKWTDRDGPHTAAHDDVNKSKPLWMFIREMVDWKDGWGKWAICSGWYTKNPKTMYVIYYAFVDVCMFNISLSVNILIYI